MDRNFVLELTNKIYKQTLLFPKKEPLRYKIRETADDILEKIVEWEALLSPNPGNFSMSASSKKKDIVFEIEKNVELIKTYFNVAKWQNWASYFDILKIEQEYDKIEEYFKNQAKSIIETYPKPQNKTLKTNKIQLDSRKKKILDILRKKEKIQVKEIKNILKNVSKRTLRRDFNALLDQGLVKRIGESNATYYKLIS